MASVKMPLMSVSASGNINKTIVYSSHRTKNIVKLFKASPVTHSDNQIKYRGRFSEAVIEWNGLSEEEKRAYDVYIQGNILTGFNYFIKNKLLDYEIDEHVKLMILISKCWGLLPEAFISFYMQYQFIGMYEN